MPTLIDTSLWIEYFRRGGDPSAKSRVERLIAEDEAAFACPTYFELLAGARPSEIDWVEEGLGYCHRFLFEPTYWNRGAQIFRNLRDQGRTVPWEDIFLAVVALEIDLPLLCRDRHFDLIRDRVAPTLQVQQLGLEDTP